MKPKRSFSASIGQRSQGNAGPDQIEYDLDQAFKMFDPLETDGGIRTENIVDANITTAKIADSSVTSNKIADNSIYTDHLVDNTVNRNKIINGEVTTEKLANASVTIDKLDPNISNSTNLEVVNARVSSGVTYSALKDRLDMNDEHVFGEAPVETLTIDTYTAATNTISVYYVSLGEFKKGKKVIIEGAGAGGADLHTTIKSISTNSFLNFHTIYFTDTIVTNPTGKKIKHAPTITDQIGILSNVVISAEKYIKDDGTDQTANITTAINNCPSGGKLVFPPNKTYTGEIIITKPIHIDLNGSKVVPPSTSTSKIISATGTKSATNYIMTSPASRGDRTLTFTASPTDIQAGDLIVLRDDSVRVGDSQTDVNLEVHKVKSVDTGANTITLKDRVRLPKSVSAAANVYKITPIKGIRIDNVVLEAKTGSTSNQGLFFDMCENVKINGVEMTNNAAACVTFKRSYVCKVNDFDFSKPQATTSGRGYGVLSTGGTSVVRVFNGHGDGMRHVVDCGNTFDVVAEKITAINNADAPFIISHNGWDSDITMRDCKSYGGNVYGFSVSGQGVSDAYTLTAYNINLFNCESVLEDASYVVGAIFDIPLKQSNINGLKLTLGTGSAISVNNTSGIRLLSVDNDCTFENIEINGFQYAIRPDSASAYPSKLQSNQHERMIFQNVKVKNAGYVIYSERIHNIHLENLIADNVSSYVLRLSSASTGAQKLRYLVLKNISVSSLGTGLVSTNEQYDSNGVLGEISNIHTNATVKNPLTVTAGKQLTLSEMLMNKNGKTVLLSSDSAVSLATSPMLNGIVEGQEITLINVGSFDITVPDGSTNNNNGGTSVVLNSAKRSISYIFTNGAWTQVA